MDQQKPGGGTGVDNATGAYWNSEGVAAPGDAQEAAMTENLVNFNGAASMECLAPKVIVIYCINLFKIVLSSSIE